MSKNVLISGYYGYENFGDDLILQVLISEIKSVCHDINKTANITVISNNPTLTSENYQVNSIHKFDFFKIIQHLFKSDLFISGGGSLFQDVTSLKSLLYYYFVVMFAVIFRVETFVYSQGIGPLNTWIGRFLTFSLFRKVSHISLRDEMSFQLIKKQGITGMKTSDPAWCIDKPKIEKVEDVVKIGVQIREHSNFIGQELHDIASVLVDKFSNEKHEIILISLQDSRDWKILNTMKNMITELNPCMNVVLRSNLSVNETINTIESLDYLIGMRYHAVLMALKFAIPTLALCYDPKVKKISVNSDIPHLDIDEIREQNLEEKINYLIDNNEQLINRIKKYSESKETLSKQNKVILSKILKE